MRNVKLIYYCTGDFEYYDLDDPASFSKYNEVLQEAGSAGVDIGVEDVDENCKTQCLCTLNYALVNPDSDYVSTCYVFVKGKDYDEEEELAARAACRHWHIDEEKYYSKVKVEKEIEVDRAEE